MEAVTFWLVIAAVLFALAVLVDLLGDARIGRLPLIPAGLLALAIAFITERN